MSGAANANKSAAWIKNTKFSQNLYDCWQPTARCGHPPMGAEWTPPMTARLYGFPNRMSRRQPTQ
jgi:hypothetical protein